MLRDEYKDVRHVAADLLRSCQLGERGPYMLHARTHTRMLACMHTQANASARRILLWNACTYEDMHTCMHTRSLARTHEHTHARTHARAHKHKPALANVLTLARKLEDL